MNDQKAAAQKALPTRPAATTPAKGTSALKDASRAETYATTQAAADGIEGDASKKNKTEDDKLAAQMTGSR